jgi:glycosyltransferase involved in cell wall biosynthesis
MTGGVAIAHDYLTQRGGAERVVLEICRSFPGAPVHTSLYDQDATFPDFRGIDVRTSRWSDLPVFRRDHRRLFPVMGPMMQARKIDADVLIASSSGWAHGMQSSGRKLVYCHTPARWIYRADEAMNGAGLRYRASVNALRPALRRWDQSAARTADKYIANSEATRALVRDVYGIDAVVLPPPLALDIGGEVTPVPDVASVDILVVSRLRSQKNVDLVIAAAHDLTDRQFVVVGTGHLMDALIAVAPSNVTFVGRVPDSELRWLYRNASMLLAPAFEDFGLTPIEAAAHGLPTVALRAGGYLETVIDGRSGVFFDELDVRAVGDAIRRCSSETWNADEIRACAEPYDRELFAERLRALVQEIM